MLGRLWTEANPVSKLLPKPKQLAPHVYKVSNIQYVPVRFVIPATAILWLSITGTATPTTSTTSTPECRSLGNKPRSPQTLGSHSNETCQDDAV